MTDAPFNKYQESIPHPKDKVKPRDLTALREYEERQEKQNEENYESDWWGDE